jgi:hypothetical protein
MFQTPYNHNFVISGYTHPGSAIIDPQKLANKAFASWTKTFKQLYKHISRKYAEENPDKKMPQILYYPNYSNRMPLLASDILIYFSIHTNINFTRKMKRFIENSIEIDLNNYVNKTGLVTVRAPQTSDPM